MPKKMDNRVERLIAGGWSQGSIYHHLKKLRAQGMSRDKALDTLCKRPRPERSSLHKAVIEKLVVKGWAYETARQYWRETLRRTGSRNAAMAEIFTRPIPGESVEQQLVCRLKERGWTTQGIAVKVFHRTRKSGMSREVVLRNLMFEQPPERRK